ncbi:MAG: SWIM zinc finger family protein [Bacteroidota bacterium]
MNVVHKEFIQNNIQKAIAQAAQKLYKKNAVRELEEPTPLHFIAYVDDQKETYDITLSLDNAHQIIKHSCDCASKEKFCEHVIAAYLSIDNKPKNTKPKILPKKILDDEVRPLLQTLPKKQSQRKKTEDLPITRPEELEIEEYLRKKESVQSKEDFYLFYKNYIKSLKQKRISSNRYTLFLFEIFHLEQDLNEMIELVDDLSSFELTMHYFDEMYVKDKIQLLKNILSKTNTVLYEKSKMYYTDKTYIDRMLAHIIKKYTKEEIRVVIQSLKFLYRSSELRYTLEKKLFPKETSI